MKIKLTHPLGEILSKKLLGIEDAPLIEQKRSIIIKFLKWKDKIIYKKTQVRYITNNDLKNIDEFPGIYIEYIYNALKDLTCRKNTELLCDSEYCPWCILLYPKCKACQYGSRHGKCISHNENNTYGKILTTHKHIKKIDINLIDIIGADTIATKMKKLFII